MNKEPFLIKIEFYQFPSCIFPLQSVSATLPQTLSCFHTLKLMTFSFDYYCYIHLNAYLQAPPTPTFNLLSLFLLYTCMWLQG